MADNSFESEVKSIQTFLSMQRTNPGSQVTQTDDNINTLSLVSPRYQKKYKAKQVHELYDFFFPWRQNAKQESRQIQKEEFDIVQINVSQIFETNMLSEKPIHCMTKSMYL